MRFLTMTLVSLILGLAPSARALVNTPICRKALSLDNEQSVIVPRAINWYPGEYFKTFARISNFVNTTTTLKFDLAQTDWDNIHKPVYVIQLILGDLLAAGPEALIGVRPVPLHNLDGLSLYDITLGERLAYQTERLDSVKVDYNQKLKSLHFEVPMTITNKQQKQDVLMRIMRDLQNYQF